MHVVKFKRIPNKTFLTPFKSMRVRNFKANYSKSSFYRTLQSQALKLLKVDSVMHKVNSNSDSISPNTCTCTDTVCLFESKVLHYHNICSPASGNILTLNLPLKVRLKESLNQEVKSETETYSFPLSPNLTNRGAKIYRTLNRWLNAVSMPAWLYLSTLRCPY